MRDAPRIDLLVGQLYEAAASGDEAWAAFAGVLSEVLGGSAVVIDDNAIAHGPDKLLVTCRFDTGRVLLHFAEFGDAASNIGVKALMEGPVGAAFDMQAGIDPDVWRADRSVASILTPQGFTEGKLLVLERNEARLRDLLVYRPERRGAYSSAEVRLIEALGPHLRRALAIRSRLREAEEGARRARETLLGVAPGILVVGRGGRILDATGLAERALADETALFSAHGRLRARDAAADGRLRARFSGDGQPLPVPLVVPAGDGRHVALRELPADVAASLPAAAGAAGAAALLVEPVVQQVELCPRVVGSAFGLTAAEAEIAIELSKGATVAEVAERRRSAVSTVRTQVKSVLRKTGSRRQGELIAKIHALRPAVAPRQRRA